jgi:four helix bundle protein
MGRDYRKLDLFHLADRAVIATYPVTSEFPAEPCNIVEGSARRGEGEYLNLLNIALGSANETRYLLDLATRLGMVTAERTTPLSVLYTELIAKLQALINSFDAKK